MISDAHKDSDQPLFGTPLDDIRHLFEGVPERSLSRQYSWDNSGVQLICHNAPIVGVTLCLDITQGVLEHARKHGHNLIISHHPLIFSPLKSILNTTPAGSILLEAVRSNINILSYHTNLDLANYSLADYILDMVGLLGGTIFEPVGTEKHYIKDSSSCFASGGISDEEDPYEEVPYGLGRIVDLPEPMTLQGVCDLFVEGLGRFGCGSFVHNVPDTPQGSVLSNGRKSLHKNTTFRRLAIVPGSGFASWEQCLSKNVDILVSGDLKHHQGLDARMAGVAMLDMGHEGSETPYLYYIKDLLKDELGLDGIVVEGCVLKSLTNTKDK